MSVAVFPLVLRARGGAWPERLRPSHWRLAVPGFPGVVLIPLGRLPTSPIPLLARVALWFHHPHLRAGHVQARRISESIEAVAIARQACGYAQRCGNNSSGIQERCRGSGGGLRFIAYSHGKSSWGGNEAVEAVETTGHFGGSVSRQGATRVNAVEAPKQPDVEADPVAIRGRPPSWRQEGTTPHDATSSRVPPGYWRWHACTGRSDATREASAVGARGPRPTTREGQVGPFEVAKRPVRARKPGNAGGAKGPQFKVSVDESSPVFYKAFFAGFSRSFRAGTLISGEV